MAHEIGEHDGLVLKEVPAWHGLGCVVNGVIKSAEAIEKANMDWEVTLANLYVLGEGDKPVPIPERFATVRTDLPTENPFHVLGVVQGRYTPIQNKQAFEFADSLADEGGINYETAGSIRNGKQIFMCCTMPDNLNIGDDSVKPYLLLRSSHDGTAPLEVMATPVRVVCANTLAAALKGANVTVSIKHTHSASEKIIQARKVLKNAQTYFKIFSERANQLAESKVSDRFVEAYLNAIFPDPKREAGDTRPVRKTAENTRNVVLALYRGKQAGGGMLAVQGTRWGLLNAVTQYIEHVRSTRKHGEGRSEDEVRFESTLWGSGSNLRQQAWELINSAEDNEPETITTVANN